MLAPASAIDTDDLRQKFEMIKIAERDRHDFVENLWNHVQRLSDDREEHMKRLRAKEALATYYQDKYEAAQVEVDSLQKAIDCDKFALVLVDGDDTLFVDDYVKDGLVGGERAARNLQQALFDHLKPKTFFKHDHKIVTKIYMNLFGLSKTYTDQGLVPGSVTFQQFVQGFNKTNELMEIIDAGNGKEAADTKIKAEFRLFYNNQQCEQIFLAGSGDNSYAGFLRQYIPKSGISGRVTLIEASPFALEMSMLSDKFDGVTFPDVFRDTKIITRKVSFHEGVRRVSTPPATSAPAVGTPVTTPTSTYAVIANTAANGVNSAGALDAGNGRTFTASKHTTQFLVTSDGKRIDRPIKNLDKDLVQKLKQRKLCNKFFLSNDCPYSSADCSHKHKGKLTAHELENLRHVARLKPCDRGMDCRDGNCCNGHRCWYGTDCFAWKRHECWFSDEMHEVKLSNLQIFTYSA